MAERKPRAMPSAFPLREGCRRLIERAPRQEAIIIHGHVSCARRARRADIRLRFAAQHF